MIRTEMGCNEIYCDVLQYDVMNKLCYIYYTTNKMIYKQLRDVYANTTLSYYYVFILLSCCS